MFMCENTKHGYKECFPRQDLERLDKLQNKKLGKHYKKWTDEEIRKVYEEVEKGTKPEDIYKMFPNREKYGVDRFISEARKKYGMATYVTKSGNNARPVEQYDLDGNFIKRYKSIGEASKETGAFHSSILHCCRGFYKQSNGYVWKFADEEREEN